MINSIATLKKAFIERANTANLDVQCAMSGTFHAELAIIAEAPGDREVTMKSPLVGGSGNRLWEVCRRFGIDRRNVYVTNVSKRQVSFGNDRRDPINKHELEVWNSLLIWELSHLPNIKYILALGNMSLMALTGHTGITNWRGSVFPNYRLHTQTHKNIDADANTQSLTELKLVTLVCTYNPAMILREPKLELTFTFDIGKLDKVIKGRWKYKPFDVHVNPSFDDAMDWIDKMERSSHGVAYDIEVIGNETACIGLADSDVEAMCINFRSLSEQTYTLEQEVRIRRRFQSFFKSSHNRLIAQNNMYDSSWLWFKDRIFVPPIYCDTMLAHHVLYPQLPHNLGYLTTQYTTRPFYKEEKDEWREGGDIDSFWTYNGQDCCNTHAVATSVISELKEQSLDKFFFNHVMYAQPHLLRMVIGGVLVDTRVQDELKDKIGTRVQELLDEFHKIVQEVTGESEYEPNPRSPKQLSGLLFTKLRLVGRGASTNAENRDQMYAHPATTEPKRRILRALNELAKEQKFYSTYVTTAIDDDGRLRCMYNQTGVQSAPGRLSSSRMLWRNSAGEQTGMNLQNQPQRAYEMYIADKGYGLGYFDLAQAESRLVGWFADIDNWIEQFEKTREDKSYDVHRALASEMFGVPYDEVPTFDHYDASKGHIIPEGKRNHDITIRYTAKRCKHGLNYRLGPAKLSATTGLSMSEAINAYNFYHKITPEVQQWWAYLESEVRKTKTLFNAFGRRLIILERLSPKAMESIIAFKPQSTLGDHVVRVIYQSHEDDKWPIDARMWLNIHDALIILAPRHKVKHCLAIAKKYAEAPIPITGMSGKIRPLIIPAETKIGKPDDDGVIRWSGLKDVNINAAK